MICVLQVTIGADHRVVDGATVARFCNEWKLLVEKPELLLLHMRWFGEITECGAQSAMIHLTIMFSPGKKNKGFMITQSSISSMDVTHKFAWAVWVNPW